MMEIIELRSDTFTLPTPKMRDAIHSAELGDDVFGEDLTTNRLEEIAAEKTGKQAAMLVVSGTMGNLICSLTHCTRAEEVILGNQSHMFWHEAGGMAALGGIHPHIITNQPDGKLLLPDIESAIRADDIHFPRTRLICLENTQNHCGGSVLQPEYTDSVVAFARSHSLAVHLDGARIFNAAVALGIDVKKLTRSVDSVMFCLSKGLSAPIGSLVCGSREFIAGARRTRKVLGGGMRQAGIIAAAGIVALEDMIERLAEDHINAKNLAEGISQIDGLSIEPEKVKTNIIYFDLIDSSMTDEQFLSALGKKGIKLLSLGPAHFRMVTHYGISSADIDRTLTALAEVMKKA
ncbi:MAG: low-specificity L-threonine aldolase [Planctomycetota bacterium]|jgi:threonine aldolase